MPRNQHGHGSRHPQRLDGAAVNVVMSGRCLYRAERVYNDDAGVDHKFLHLHATSHTTGTPMDERNWPERLDLWHLMVSSRRRAPSRRAAMKP
jgi:hypothetical protein